jgi:hypothetical protein
MSTPRYDPFELAAAGLTEEDADELHDGMLGVARGDTVPSERSFDRIVVELEALNDPAMSLFRSPCDRARA